MIPKNVTIKEVGPRDGLQNEKSIISTEVKVDWINKLSLSGLSYIEITSFVHPKWIPQLADHLEVAKQIKRNPNVTYGALVPNERGLEGALEAQIDDIAVFMSSSETHNEKNINKSIHDTYPVLAKVIKEAKSAGKTTRGYVSTVFGCPYEGDVSVQQVRNVTETLLEMGIDEISLGDTIGIADPRQVNRVLEVLLMHVPKEKIALHFHNTRGMALANIVESLRLGIDTFDASLGGLGGCPYAPGAAGNVATDDLVFMLEKMGVSTGIDQERLLQAASLIQQKLGRNLPSHQMQMITTKKS